MSKLAALATMLCTMTALPAIHFREEQAKEQAEQARAGLPPKPELKAGQTAKFDPLSRAWRIYTPKQPKYRVVFETSELEYLESRFHNAQLTEARNELQAIKCGSGHKKERKFLARARVARGEADACARTINELKSQA